LLVTVAHTGSTIICVGEATVWLSCKINMIDKMLSKILL
jgi:hypothetical protein